MIENWAEKQMYGQFLKAQTNQKRHRKVLALVEKM